MVASFDDCFFMAGVIFLLALVPTLMLRINEDLGTSVDGSA
jgi:hypothetical protein